MKRYNIYIAIALFVIGVVIGIWTCRKHYIGREGEVQRDPIVMRDTFHYTKEKIVTKNVLVEKPCTVYVKATEIVYKDSVRYVALPRQYYHTTTKDAEIWHSGIESSIDSLNVFKTTLTITERKTFKNAVYLGAEAEYFGRFLVPIYLQYERAPNKWFSYSGKVGYDIIGDQWIVGGGVKARFQW